MKLIKLRIRIFMIQVKMWIIWFIIAYKISKTLWDGLIKSLQKCQDTESASQSTSE